MIDRKPLYLSEVSLFTQRHIWRVFSRWLRTRVASIRNILSSDARDWTKISKRRRKKRKGRTLLLIQSHGSKLFVYHRWGRIWNKNKMYWTTETTTEPVQTFQCRTKSSGNTAKKPSHNKLKSHKLWKAESRRLNSELKTQSQGLQIEKAVP